MADRLRLLVALICVFLTLVTGTLHAQTKSCSPTDYKVLGSAFVAIGCEDAVKDSDATIAGAGTLLLVEDTKITQLNATLTISSFTAANFWMLVSLSGRESVLKPKHKYRLILNYDVAHRGTGEHIAHFGPVKVDIDLAEIMTIASEGIPSNPKLYQATAHIGFEDAEKRLEYKAGDGLPQSPCQLYLRDDIDKNASVKAKCSALSSLTSTTPGLQELSGLDPDRVGVYTIAPDNMPHAVLVLAPLPLKDIFGNSFTIDPKSRIEPPKAPLTKDASSYYIAFNYAAGVGTVPAWVLDGKIAPQIGFYKGFVLGPLATANVGNNKLKGQTYTDTIDFCATAQRIFQPNDVLQELLLTLGPTYETDKEFDRHNLLATADLKYNFARLYRTQSVATRQRFYAAKQRADELKEKAKSDKSVEPSIPQLDEMKPALFGRALDFHTGLEAGGALVDTTVKASAGNATQVLPTYSIFRVVPQIHGLLEIWRFSVDMTMIGRYLVATENTVVESASHALFLKPVQGWKGIGTINSTYNLDSQGHFAVNVTFKDGFAPPSYQRVNAVQAGLLLKY